MFHIALHFILPAIVAIYFFKKDQRKAYLLMMLTMLVDADHLIATPIYDANRCSIGFHLLHQWKFILVYMVMCFIPKTRWLGLGLTIHMALDGTDCLTM